MLDDMIDYSFNPGAKREDIILPFTIESGIYAVRSLEDPNVWVLRSIMEETEIAVSTQCITYERTDLRIGNTLKDYTGNALILKQIIINPESLNKSTICLRLNKTE